MYTHLDMVLNQLWNVNRTVNEIPGGVLDINALTC